MAKDFFKMNQIEDLFPVEDGDYHCNVTLLECKSKEKTSNYFMASHLSKLKLHHP